MPAYKDKDRGTWYASFYYTDWQGARKLKKKRGFARKQNSMSGNFSTRKPATAI